MKVGEIELGDVGELPGVAELPEVEAEPAREGSGAERMVAEEERRSADADLLARVPFYDEDEGVRREVDAHGKYHVYGGDGGLRYEQVRSTYGRDYLEAAVPEMANDPYTWVTRTVAGMSGEKGEKYRRRAEELARSGMDVKGDWYAMAGDIVWESVEPRVQQMRANKKEWAESGAETMLGAVETGEKVEAEDVKGEEGNPWARLYDMQERGVISGEGMASVRRASDAWSMARGMMDSYTDAQWRAYGEASTLKLIYDRLGEDERAQGLFFEMVKRKAGEMAEGEAKENAWVRFAHSFTAADRTMFAEMAGGNYHRYLSDEEVDRYNASRGIGYEEMGDAEARREVVWGANALATAKEAGQFDEGTKTARYLSAEEKARIDKFNRFRGQFFQAVDGAYDVDGSGFGNVLSAFGSLAPGTALFFVPGVGAAVGTGVAFRQGMEEQFVQDLAEGKDWDVAGMRGFANGVIQGSVENIAFTKIGSAFLPKWLKAVGATPFMSKALGRVFGTTAGRVALGVGEGTVEETFLEPLAGAVMGWGYNVFAPVRYELDDPWTGLRQEVREMLKPGQLGATLLLGGLLGAMSVPGQRGEAEEYRKLVGAMELAGVDAGRAGQVARMEDGVQRMATASEEVAQALSTADESKVREVADALAEAYPEMQILQTVAEFYEAGGMPKLTEAGKNEDGERLYKVEVKGREATVMPEGLARGFVRRAMEEMTVAQQVRMADEFLADRMVEGLARDKRYVVEEVEGKMDGEYFERMARAAHVALAGGHGVDEVVPEVHSHLTLGEVARKGEEWRQRMAVARNDLEQRLGRRLTEEEWAAQEREYHSPINRQGLRQDRLAGRRMRTLFRYARGKVGAMGVLEDVTEDNFVRYKATMGVDNAWFAEQLRELGRLRGKENEFVRELKEGEEYTDMDIVEGVGKLVRGKVLADTARKDNGLPAWLNRFLDILRAWVREARALMEVGRGVNRYLFADEEARGKFDERFRRMMEDLTAQDVEYLRGLQREESEAAQGRILRAARSGRAEAREERPVMDAAEAEQGEQAREDAEAEEAYKAEIDAEVSAALGADTSMNVVGRNEEEVAAKEKYEGTAAAAAVSKVVEGVKEKVRGATTRAEYEARVPVAERRAMSQEEVVMMPVGQGVIDAVRDATGRDVTGYYHSVSEEMIWHAMYRHSRDSQSTRYAGQLDLTWEDFALLPDILETGEAEVKRWAEDTTVTYTKDYGNVHYTVVQRVGKKHRYNPSKMMFVTEWIEKVARRSGLAPDTARGNAPSSPSTGSVAQAGEDVKGENEGGMSFSVEDAREEGMMKDGVMVVGNGVVVEPGVDFSMAVRGAQHASPHLFREFDTAHIGSGEGAQAYGWGLYFSTNWRVNENYWDNFSGEKWAVSVDGREMRTDADVNFWYVPLKEQFERDYGLSERGAHAATMMLQQVGEGRGTLQERIEFYMRRAAEDIERMEEELRHEQTEERRESLEQQLATRRGFVEAAEFLGRREVVVEKRHENAVDYLVDLDVEDWELLPFDEALGEMWDRNEGLRAGVEENFRRNVKGVPEEALRVLVEGTREESGRELYEALEASLGGARAASEWLLAHGVKGVRYEDGISRKREEKTYNYVIFDGDVVKLRKVNNRGEFTSDEGAGQWQVPEDVRWEQEGVSMNVEMGGEDRDMVAAHVLSVDSLMDAEELGGMPLPSVAVTRADKFYGWYKRYGYDAVVLIGKPEMVDPKRGTLVYERDAWTGVMPRGWRGEDGELVYEREDWEEGDEEERYMRTLEEVTEYMMGRKRRGGEDRARPWGWMAREFRSMKEVKAHRGLLGEAEDIPVVEMKRVERMFNDQVGKPMFSWGIVALAVADVPEVTERAVLARLRRKLPGYKNVNGVNALSAGSPWIGQLVEVMKKLRGMKRSYMEAVPRRAVGLEEWRYAYIPEEMVASRKQEVKKVCRREGIEVREVAFDEMEDEVAKLKNSEVSFAVRRGDEDVAERLGAGLEGAVTAGSFKANEALVEQMLGEIRKGVGKVRRLAGRAKGGREEALAVMGGLAQMVRAVRMYLPTGFGFAVEPYIRQLEVLSELATMGRVEFNVPMSKALAREVKGLDEEAVKELGEAKLEEVLERVMGRVAEQLRRYAKREVVARMEKVLAGLELKKKNGKLKGGKMGAEGYRAMDKVREAMGSDGEAVARRLEAIQAELGRGDEASEMKRDELEGDMAIWSTFGNVEGMSFESAAAAYETLRFWVAAERFAWDDKKADMDVARADVVRGVMKELGRAGVNAYHNAKVAVAPSGELKSLGDLFMSAVQTMRSMRKVPGVGRLLEGIALRVNRAGELMKTWERERWARLEALSRHTLGGSWRRRMDEMHRQEETGVAFDRPIRKTVEIGREYLHTLLGMTAAEREREYAENRAKGGVMAKLVYTEKDLQALAAEEARLEGEVAEGRKRKVPGKIRVRYVEDVQHEENLRLSRGEALYVILMAEQPTYTARMEAAGWTEEVVEGLRRFVGEKWLEFGYGLREMFAEQGERLAAIYERVYGVPFPREENYFAARFNVEHKSGDTATALLEASQGQPGMGQGWMKPRVMHDLEVDTNKDALQVFLQATQMTDAWMATQDIVADMRAYMRNREFTRAVVAALGKENFDNLKSWIDALEMGGVRDGVNMGAAQNVIRRLYGAAAVSILGFRVQTWLRQIPAIFNGLLGAHDISTGEWMAAMAGVRKGTARMTLRRMLESDFMKNRGADFGTMKGQAMRSGEERSSALEAVLEAGMKPMGVIDAGLTAVSLVPVWNVYYERAVRGGMSEEEAEAEAWAQTEAVANMSSQPIGWLNRAKVAQQRSVLAQGAMFMLSEATNKVGLVTGLWKAGKRKAAVRAWLVYGAANAMVSALLDYLQGDPDEWEKGEWWEYVLSAIYGPLASMPGVGEALEAIGTQAVRGIGYAVGNEGMQKASMHASVGRALIDVGGSVRAVNKVYKMMTDDKEHGAADYARAVSTVSRLAGTVFGAFGTAFGYGAMLVSGLSNLGDFGARVWRNMKEYYGD